MTQMIRKQIYIQRRQQVALKRLARLRGLSEAEVIRQAIEREAEAGAIKLLSGDTAALQDFLKFARSRRATGGARRAWKRDDLYEERLNRYDRANR
ncbi:MAG: hypothetical protein AAB217_15265 [Chloroflexota bacterium]